MPAGSLPSIGRPSRALGRRPLRSIPARAAGGLGLRTSSIVPTISASCSRHRSAPLRKEGRPEWTALETMSGGDLLSRGIAPQVPSALAGLTSVFGMGTGGSPPLSPPETQWISARHPEHSIASTHVEGFYSSPRPISTGQLNALLRLHTPPIKRVVFPRSYSLNGMGDLILERVSHLDAFSGYLCPT